MTNKISAFLLLFVFIGSALVSAAQNQPQKAEVVVSTNLNRMENGQLRVLINAPQHQQDTLIYAMPKIVPGTYAIADYGVLLRDVTATSVKGQNMPVVALDKNRWMIVGAKDLKSLSYLAVPSFTDPSGKHIFEPAGTRFEKDKNFVLNNFGLVGYFEGFENLNYRYEVSKPAQLYGATALQSQKMNDTLDVFTASGYFDFHDSPIMYAVPDTARIFVGKTRIEVAVYSPGKSIDARFVMNEVKDIMIGAEAYLGGNLPVDRYVILITLIEGITNSGGFGALEHAYSTVFVLPEMPRDFLVQSIRDVTAHEFFHIVTPLNIHSEHIHNYNFSEPKMSQHLWFYEGCTEYAAHHMQVQQKLISPDDFLEIIAQKTQQATAYKDELPFTEMSKGALDQHAGQYGNVYQKGALIGLCLDLLLCKLSDGNYSLPQLTADLSKKFGPQKPFTDEELFNEITALTYPEVGRFFERYVAGPEPLPMQEYLSWAGVNFIQNATINEITFGGFLPGFNESRQLMEVATTIGMNSFGRNLGLQKGDAFISVNGISLKPENFKDGLNRFKNETKAGEKVSVEILRQDKKGNWKKKTLTGTAEMVERKVYLHIEWAPNPTAEQLAVRKAWIKN